MQEEALEPAAGVRKGNTLHFYFYLHLLWMTCSLFICPDVCSVSKLNILKGPTLESQFTGFLYIFQNLEYQYFETSCVHLSARVNIPPLDSVVSLKIYESAEELDVAGFSLAAA